MSRSSTPALREVYPQFGARHKIPYGNDPAAPNKNDELDFFFADLRRQLTEDLPPEKIIIEKTPPDGSTEHKPRIRERPLFRIYDDPDRMGITIFERRMLNQQRTPVRWTQRDKGRIRGDIQNAIAKSDLINTSLEATFTHVMRLGDNGESGKKARKLGLVIEQQSDISELMIQENEICTDGISGSIGRRFNTWYDEYIPHWTVARIDRKIGSKHVARAIEVVENLLPLTVQIDPITFYSNEYDI